MRLLEKGIRETILLLIFAFFVRTQALGQGPVTSNSRSNFQSSSCLNASDAANEESSNSKCQNEEEGQQAEVQRKTGVIILRDADEKAWLANLQYYVPRPGFNRKNRDIDVSDIRVARAWHFRLGLEFQFGGLVFRASGTRTTDTSPPSLERSDALGLGFGPVGRWNFLQIKRLRLFGEAGPDLIFTNNPFPAGGTKYDFFLHAGGGAAFRLNESYWLEASFSWTHISNGQGIGPGNPAWQGQGVAVGIRHAFRIK
jgi:hypothetical protein